MPAPEFLSLADVTPREMEWIWDGWIPKGALTFIVGEPGVGKSSMSWDLLARLTAGTQLPDGSECVSGRALLISGEDNLENWIAPQLRKYGAVLSRIDSFRIGAQGRSLQLDVDCSMLEQRIRDANIGIVVIDPLDAFLGKVNPNNAAEVRAITNGLCGVAERTGAAIVVLHHFNKSQSASTTNRVSGSIDLVGAARSMLYVVPETHRECNRIVFVAKSNLGAKPEAMMFRLGDDERIEWAVLPEGYDWRGAASATRDGVVDDAKRFLKQLLDESGEAAALSSFVKEQAAAAGISKHALEKAKAALGIRSVRDGGRDGRWYYRYRQHEDEVQWKGQKESPTPTPSCSLASLEEIEKFMI